MRKLLSLLSLTLVYPSQAQFITSVQNGFWGDTATWSCACVPPLGQNVTIAHEVAIDGALNLTHPHIYVTAAGDLSAMTPSVYNLNADLQNSGHILLLGEIAIQGYFTNYTTAEFVGTVSNAGTIVNGTTALFRVEGDLDNQYVIQGGGSVCVSDLTSNEGTITGVDFCDGSPTTTVPPIIDDNTGIVLETVTFCENTGCFVGIPAHLSAPMTLSPDGAPGSFVLSGIPVGTTSVRLRDASGASVGSIWRPNSSTLKIDVPGLAAGAYRVVVTGAAGQRVLPFVVLR